MTPERWQQIKRVFQSLIERPPAERAAYLDGACADDPDLRGEVEALISANEQAGATIEIRASEVAGVRLAQEHPGQLPG